MARYAEDARERTSCPLCRGPLDDCSDEHKDWYPQRTVCRKTMALQFVRDKYDARHEALPWHDGSFTEWAKERDADHPYHYLTGVHLWVADVDYSPDDDFLVR